MDTVGVEGMRAPFDPVERDGRLYGRGAQDMKSGVAAMIDAACVATAPRIQKRAVVVAAVIDEEYPSIGADALAQVWRADAAVVTEPTDLQIGVASERTSCITRLLAENRHETIGRANQMGKSVVDAFVLAR